MQLAAELDRCGGRVVKASRMSRVRRASSTRRHAEPIDAERPRLAIPSSPPVGESPDGSAQDLGVVLLEVPQARRVADTSPANGQITKVGKSWSRVRSSSGEPSIN